LYWGLFFFHIQIYQEMMWLFGQAKTRFSIFVFDLILIPWPAAHPLQEWFCVLEWEVPPGLSVSVARWVSRLGSSMPLHSVRLLQIEALVYSLPARSFFRALVFQGTTHAALRQKVHWHNSKYRYSVTTVRTLSVFSPMVPTEE
jgi:hypothetical protein